jgi:hypothetical protein
VALHIAQDDTATETFPVSRAEHKIVRHFVPLANSISRCGFLWVFFVLFAQSGFNLKRHILEQK